MIRLMVAPDISAATFRQLSECGYGVIVLDDHYPDLVLPFLIKNSWSLGTWAIPER